MMENLEYQIEVALLSRSVQACAVLVIIFFIAVSIPLVIVVSHILVLSRKVLARDLMIQEIQIDLLDIMILQKVYVHATGRLRDSLLQLHQVHRRVKVGCVFAVI